VKNTSGNQPSIRDLEARRDLLLRQMRFADLAASGELPDFLRAADLPELKKILEGADALRAEEGLYPDAGRLLKELQKTEEGKRLFLDTEVRFLEKVMESGADQAVSGPMGLFEGLFPVRARGRILHCLRSGKMRRKPFAAEEIGEIARLCGCTQAEAREMAGSVPVLSRKQLDRVLVWCENLRNALEQAVVNHVRAAELAQQHMQTERAQSLGTLSGGVAHHFNSLLSVILGYSSLVLNREKLSAEASDALRKISEAAQRGRRLTQEILAFLGGGAEDLAPSPIHDTIHSVLSLLESKTGSKVHVETRLDARQHTVLTSASAIRQIVFNLLTNAIDSMPGGGRLSIATTNVTRPSKAGKQEYLQMEVTDTGGGVPRGAEGGARAGLKLSSVSGMVGQLDGTVVVSSEPGKVTRVQVLLPTVVAGVHPAEEQKARVKLQPGLVWVVDDDAIFREMCHQVLSGEGHRVDEVGGGREFQEKWAKTASRPDLLIVDFSMPEMNGLEICEWLRGQGADVPVVLVSGFAATQPDIRKALKIKKTFFLQKPFSSRELADRVAVALGEMLIGVKA
jgi:CheY-like chemotaxis protein